MLPTRSNLEKLFDSVQKFALRYCAAHNISMSTLSSLLGHRNHTIVHLFRERVPTQGKFLLFLQLLIMYLYYDDKTKTNI